MNLHNNDNNALKTNLISPASESLLSLISEQQTILDNAGVGICYVLDRRIQRCNQHYALIHGYDTAEQMYGMCSSVLYTDSQSYEALGKAAYPVLARGERYQTEIPMRRRNGDVFWCRLTGTMVDPEQESQGTIWIVEDISEQRKAAEKFKALNQRQQLIFDHAMVGIVFIQNRCVTSCNKRFAEMLGHTPDELLGVSSRTWYPDKKLWEEAGRYYDDFLAKGLSFRSEIELTRKDGSKIWCDVRSKAINSEDLSQGSIWIMMDISERKAHQQALEAAQHLLEERVKERTRDLERVVSDLHREIDERILAEERIRHLAQHDSLTGLPNRNLFEQRLEEQIHICKDQDKQLAVLFLDLDRFKHINDSLGHHEGDILLKSIAERLRLAISGESTIARIGGDEFVIMLPNISSHLEVETVITGIQEALQPTLNIGLHELRISCSTGIALCPDDGVTPQTLIQHADIAMYRAKAQGRNRFQFYNHQLDQEQLERAELENALFHALKQQEFELHYQPQVNIKTGRIDGVEALIRWNRPDHGMVSPGAFIPLAEECGLIADIGDWVLEQACSQMHQWQQAGIKLQVSVNLSALQLDDPDFCEHVSDCLERFGLEADQLELELTESILMKHVDQTTDLLQTLDQMGVHLSIDDFGTGYSSLSYLKRFPLDKLKIDQSFVREISVDKDDAVICRTIISMAENLNLKVTAEGVETPEQLALLAEFGCHQYQGYLFSKPLPAKELQALYLQQKGLAEPTYTI